MNKRIKSFGYAVSGFGTLLSTQVHARFHLAATILVVGAAVFFKVSRLDWMLLILCITSVWVAEALNTAIEFLADEVSLEWSERIKCAKDVAAFGVLVASTGAASVGLLVFFPYLIELR